MDKKEIIKSLQAKKEKAEGENIKQAIQNKIDALSNGKGITK